MRYADTAVYQKICQRILQLGRPCGVGRCGVAHIPNSKRVASYTLLLRGSGVLLGIFLLHFIAFRSTRDALLVMLNLPLAMIGGMLGVYASGGIFWVAAIVGFMTLFGVATRNGVMMIGPIRH